MRGASACGPQGLWITVRSPPLFALSLSKGQAELVEAFAPCAKGFDRLSPNGDEAALRYLRANGSEEQTVMSSGNGRTTDIGLRFMSLGKL
jgi:hypothetical protein